MGLTNRNGSAVTEQWARDAWDVFKVLVNCYITVYKPASLEGTYNPDTGKYEKGADTILYVGPARVQARRTGERDFTPGDDSRLQWYQFQIDRRDYFEVDDDNTWVRIDDGGLQEALTGRELVVLADLNSGNSFEYTFNAINHSGR